MNIGENLWIFYTVFIIIMVGGKNDSDSIFCRI